MTRDGARHFNGNVPNNFIFIFYVEVKVYIHNAKF
jgi:hypothetical protein